MKDKPRMVCRECYFKTRIGRGLRRYGHGDPWLLECASEQLWFPGCSWEDYEKTGQGETLILIAPDGAQGQLYDLDNIYFAELDGEFFEAE